MTWYRGMRRNAVKVSKVGVSCLRGWGCSKDAPTSRLEAMKNIAANRDHRRSCSRILSNQNDKKCLCGPILLATMLFCFSAPAGLLLVHLR